MSVATMMMAAVEYCPFCSADAPEKSNEKSNENGRRTSRRCATRNCSAVWMHWAKRGIGQDRACSACNMHLVTLAILQPVRKLHRMSSYQLPRETLAAYETNGEGRDAGQMCWNLPGTRLDVHLSRQ